ncbi:MAG TPA: aminotransferase class V-fold PLP-dependent enzyme [Geminicoccus sp.]|jgi:cysteine desulfurase/selenocysteine lyase|uniref:aminotransferase class V-fold PLP-dependent enzyme n=1 Tax=Geminicoccus sp. TaxID=2024832 RepID=UPI002E37B797|nr:aminotransferase class V-fold PLP-dependent enzyme [Geminicoccus sp.]HEX2527731.1 aminotransferase class V-fold PLP-dependent enzyme [Geminicoccus sp.]
MNELRQDFPAYDTADGAFHFLDNAATSQICRPALEALVEFETNDRANVKRGVYARAERATNAFASARKAAAFFINAPSPDEVIFTSGATLGLNTAAHILQHHLESGEVILVSELEHHSNLVPWQLAAERRGAKVRAIPVTDDGRLDLDKLDDLADRVKIVAVTHTSNVTGAVTDVARLRSFCDATGALLVLDGAQRAPHGPLDVQALGCDMYAFSGHKAFGPTGIGVLWGRYDLLDSSPPFLGGGEMIRRVSIERSTFAPPPHRYEAGTPPIGGAIALAAALEWSMSQDWAALGAQERDLTEKMLNGLSDMCGCRLYGPTGTQQRVGVVSFELEDVHAHDVCQLMDSDHGVMLRGGHHCAQPLMDRFDTVATVRASLAPYSDQADVDALLNGLEAVRRKLA